MVSEPAHFFSLYVLVTPGLLQSSPYNSITDYLLLSAIPMLSVWNSWERLRCPYTCALWPDMVWTPETAHCMVSTPGHGISLICLNNWNFIYLNAVMHIVSFSIKTLLLLIRLRLRTAYLRQHDMPAHVLLINLICLAIVVIRPEKHGDVLLKCEIIHAFSATFLSQSVIASIL